MERWANPAEVFAAEMALARRTVTELTRCDERWSAEIRHADRSGSVKVVTVFNDDETGPVVSVDLHTKPETLAAMLTQVWRDPARERQRRLRAERATS